MSLTETRRQQLIPYFSARCDDCNFEIESMGMNSAENMMAKAKAHRDETGHTTEVFIHQSLIIYRGNPHDPE